MRPGGLKKVSSENLALKHQLMVLSRNGKKPRLTGIDRLLLGAWAGLLGEKRLAQSLVILKPSTVLKFHKALVKRKYKTLFSPKKYKKPGPQGPPKEVIHLVLEIKKLNPRFGSLKIAMTVHNALGIDIDKDIVRRILQKYGHLIPPRDGGPSWLTCLAHTKESLWSLDFFRCESITLKSHWVMVVMDIFTRRIIGFAVHCGDLDGPTICTLFHQIRTQQKLPKYLSTDNGPLFQYWQWKANLEFYGIKKIQSTPYIPRSHPYIERLIGTVRQELLDQTFFRNKKDLQKNLDQFAHYYNEARAHAGIHGQTPLQKAGQVTYKGSLHSKIHWKPYCQGLFHVPLAA